MTGRRRVHRSSWTKNPLRSPFVPLAPSWKSPTTMPSMATVVPTSGLTKPLPCTSWIFTRVGAGGSTAQSLVAPGEIVAVNTKSTLF